MASIRDLAKWGYNNYGASLDFRKTELWSFLDPLINSPLIPKEWGNLEEILDRTQKNFKQDIEKALNFESQFGLAEISPGYITDEEPPLMEVDYLEESPSFTTDNTKTTTNIDYNVFFQE